MAGNDSTPPKNTPATRAACALRALAVALLATLAMVVSTPAAVKTYTKTIRQTFSGSQTPDDARIAAVARAKWEILEEAGVYVESLSVVRDGKLESEKILALAAGVLRTKITREESFVEGGKYGIAVTAQVQVDTSVMEKRVRKLLEDRELLDQYRQSQARAKELINRVNELERKNADLMARFGGDTSDQALRAKDALKSEFEEASQSLEAIGLVKDALDLLADTAIPFNQDGLEDGKIYDPRVRILDSAILDLLEQALRLDPNYAYAYNTRAALYIIRKEYAKAQRDLEKAISILPSNASLHNNLGLVYSRQSQFYKAVKERSKAIELDPTARLYAARAWAYSELGFFSKALADYDSAIRIDPDEANYRLRKARLHYRFNKMDEALRLLNAIDTSTAPKDRQAEAHNVRGMIYAHQNNTTAALREYDTALTLYPGAPEYLVRRGQLLDKLGRRDEACRDARKACTTMAVCFLAKELNCQ